MTSYTAFLRGINVGGHKLIKMEELNRIFVSLGFKNIKTFIQSGNVLFDAPGKSSAAALEKPDKKIEAKIEAGLKKALGYEVRTTVRTVDELKKLIELDPFKKFSKLSPKEAKMYVSFLYDEPEHKPKLPYKSPEKDFEIIGMNKLSSREVFIIAYPSVKKGGDYMTYLSKEFKKIQNTTRNWNTILKMISPISNE
ncbi:MAG TPA: DUF1697 domain-containing protein [Ignavibacteria bacterium]|nr:DUF1697 domain-containing protein [Ignavibacteria bacterium]